MKGIEITIEAVKNDSDIICVGCMFNGSNLCTEDLSDCLGLVDCSEGYVYKIKDSENE